MKPESSSQPCSFILLQVVVFFYGTLSSKTLQSASRQWLTWTVWLRGWEPAVNEAAGKRGGTKASISWEAGGARNFGLGRRRRKKKKEEKYRSLEQQLPAGSMRGTLQRELCANSTETERIDFLFKCEIDLTDWLIFFDKITLCQTVGCSGVKWLRCSIVQAKWLFNCIGLINAAPQRENT